MTPARNTQAYLDSHRAVQADAEPVRLAPVAQARNTALMANLSRSLARLAAMAVK